MGIPVVSLVTKQFERLAVTTAKGRKYGDLNMIVLPFPYDQLPAEERREITESRVQDVVDALTKGGHSRAEKGAST